MTYGIVISSYQYGHLAGHCIETILEQSRPFDEILFVDDGGHDCGHLPKLYPQVTNYVFRSENLGTVANFQNMLEKVESDMVMFLGADNWLRPDTLEILEKERDWSDADIVVYDGVVVGTQKEWAKKHFQSKPYQGGYLWQRKGQHHGSMLYNVKKAKEAGGYWSKNAGNTLEDLNLFNSMTARGAKVSWLEVPLLYYRRHIHNFNPC